jgi:Ca-activated chloride channel family protein
LVLELEKIIDPKQPVATNDTMVFEQMDQAPPVPQIDVSTIPDKDSTGELSKVKFAPNNVVFLIDVSNSMKSPIKLPLLKDGMKQLLGVLRDVDQVTVIAYANTVWTVVQTTKSSDSNKDSISIKVDSLAAGGGTHGFQGLEGAYSAIVAHYIHGGNNQVFIATDGLFNGSGDKSRQNVLNLAKEKSNQGITLSVIGFGSEPDGLKLMKEMADAGKGSFIHFTKGCDPGTLLVDEIKNRSIVTHVAHP